MSEAKVLYCTSCGAPLNVDMNRAFVFCQFCGAKNVVESQQMKAKINLGNINISANTDVDQLIQSAEYAISIDDYDKANDLLMAAIMSGKADYRVYINKAKMDLILDNNKGLFEDLESLRKFEASDKTIASAIKELMHYKGMNGITALHNATYHERLDMVKFCVEHGADVNAIAGMNQVTPISIMYVPIPAGTANLNGTPFVRNKNVVKQIREYLMAHGATDSIKNRIYGMFGNYGNGRKVNKVIFCLLALFFGSFGVHRFYAGRTLSGIFYILFIITCVPTILSVCEFVIALLSEADEQGNIMPILNI